MNQNSRKDALVVNKQKRTVFLKKLCLFCKHMHLIHSFCNNARQSFKNFEALFPFIKSNGLQTEH